MRKDPSEYLRCDPAQADGFADALAFAHQTQCRGCDLEDFRPLLNDLETLTNRIVARAKVEAAR